MDLVICACLSALSLIFLLGYHISIRKELTHSRRDISRFPLFAARDELVLLIADGTLKEADAGWQVMYRIVNQMLKMDQEMDALSLTILVLRNNLRADKDLKTQKKKRELIRKVNQTCHRHPEFKAVVGKIDHAVVKLVLHRSSAWHIAVSVFGLLIQGALRFRSNWAKTAQKTIMDPSWKLLVC